MNKIDEIYSLSKQIYESNDINNILNLKNNIDDILNEHISKAKLQDDINHMNFGNLKDIFENISTKLFRTDNGRKLIHKFIKTINENNSLLNLYALHENILNSSNMDEYVIKESISFYNDNYNIKLYRKGLKDVSSIVTEGLKLINTTNLDDISYKDNKDLNEAVDYIATHKKSIKNLPLYNENVKRILNKHQQNDNIVDTSEINENKDINNNVKRHIFENYKNDCLNIINNIINNKPNYDNKLNEIKDKLSVKEFNNNCIDDDLFHLIELKNTLSKNE